jgi:hypothetical protein
LTGVEAHPRRLIRHFALLIEGVLRLGLLARHPIGDDGVFMVE